MLRSVPSSSPAMQRALDDIEREFGGKVEDLTNAVIDGASQQMAEATLMLRKAEEIILDLRQRVRDHENRERCSHKALLELERGRTVVGANLLRLALSGGVPDAA